MSNAEGFGPRATKADRDLYKSARELSAIHKVLRKNPSDSAGRRKMLKQLKRYYRGPLAELDRIDMKEPTFPKVAEWMPRDEEREQIEQEQKTQINTDKLRQSLSKDVSETN